MLNLNSDKGQSVLEILSLLEDAQEQMDRVAGQGSWQSESISTVRVSMYRQYELGFKDVDAHRGSLPAYVRAFHWPWRSA